MAFWLGTGEKASQWRSYLLLNHLDTQAALGDRANVAELQQILDRFNRDVDGLEHPAFVEVKEGLKRHINFLANRQSIDFKSTLESATYQPIKRETVEKYRDLAIFEYQVLVNYYRSNMESRPRALLFHELKIDTALEVLESIDMDVLMPENELEIIIEPIIEGPQPDDGDDDQDDEQESEMRKAKRTEWLNGLRLISRALTDKNLEINDPYFASTQLAVDRFIRLFFFATNENSEKSFERELKVLQDNIDSLNDPNARPEHALVGNSLGWMQSANQMPQLVSAIRAKHSLPNLYVAVSSNLLNQIASRPISQSQIVNETVLGRLVRGTATTTGSVTLDLIDDPHQAHVSIHLLAAVESSTRSGQGSIAAFTSSGGQLEARRSIFANLSGFFAGEPYGAANLSSNFLGINKKLKIILKFAYKAYLKDRAAAEGIAAARAERQIIAEITKETDAALKDGNERFADLVDKVEKVSKLVPETFIRTISQKLLVTSQKSNQFDLAANDLPDPGYVPVDIGVQLHETFLTNYLTPIFSGKRLSNQQMADRLFELGVTPPDGLEPADEDDEFSITFATVQPVKVEFVDDRVKISILGVRFAQAGRNINSSLVISFQFQIIREQGKLFLKKDGETTIDYAKGSRKSSRSVAFKNFLQGKLREGDEEVKIELPKELIPIAEMGIDDHDDILKSLKLTQFVSQKGWLRIGWNYLPGNSYPAVTETPSIENTLTIQGMTDEYAPLKE
jgi:hypothetical protein